MKKRLDLDLLGTLVAIADGGSVSRAAVRVGRTQSAVSMQIRRLEQEIGSPLIERTGRGVRLTPTGEHTVRHARRLLQFHDEVLADLISDNPIGTVRFGLADDYVDAFLPSLISTFSARNPRVAVDIVCAATPALRRELQEGRIDLAILTLPHSPKRYRLRLEPLVWVGAEHGSAESMDPLPLALSLPASVDRKAALRALRAIGREYRIVYESGSGAGLMGVVRSNLAVAVLARCTVPADFRILAAPHGLPDLPTVDLVCAIARSAPPPARRLADHITAVLPRIA